jgi:hypothetical protein
MWAAHNIFFKVLFAKKIAPLFLTAALAAGAFYAAPAAQHARKLIKKFTIDVAVLDNHRYINMIMQMALSRDDFKNILEFNFTDVETAERDLASGKIPCYITVPEGFTDSVLTGANKSVVLTGAGNPVEFNAAKALLTAGTAFLKSSQRGIYATLDAAREAGFEDIDLIVREINLEYAKALLSYRDYFDEEIIFPEGALPLSEHYFFSAMCFLLTITGAFFFKNIKKILAVLELPVAKKFSGVLYADLFIAYLVLSAPLIYFIGIRAVAVSVFAAGLALFCARVFRRAESAYTFVFSVALLSAFISGGTVPKGLLPETVNNLAFLSVNNYVVLKSNWIFVYAVIATALMFGAGKIYENI